MKYLFLTSLLMLTACDELKCKADQVTLDMSEDDLINICGLPERRNYSSHGSTQYAYWGNEMLFVYVENGKVRSKQWTK